MAGSLNRVYRFVLLRVCFVRQPYVDEKAILCIDSRRPKRLGVDGNEPLALFAGRFGQELFEPRAEIGNAGRGDDGDLVAAGFSQHTQNRAEDHTWIVGGRHVRGT